MAEHDRDAILSRRALLVATAVAGLRCSSPRDRARPVSGAVPEPSVTGIAGVSSVAPAPSSADPIAVPPTKWIPWSEVMTHAPPLDPPTSSLVSKRETEALRELSHRWKSRYAALGEAWDAFPAACGVSECPERWASVEATARPARGFEEDLCPDPEQPRSGLQRQEAHRRFYAERGRELHVALGSRADALGQRAAFDALVGMRVIARSCLSCVVPRVHVPHEITFASQRSDLDAEARASIDAVVEVFDRDPNMVLHVRGHVDPKERGDHNALASARIAAVRSALIGRGIAAHRLLPLPLADAVPIAPSGTEEGARRNRRVEFERAD
jgi:outer membrane protein OmpA-like peptidoglycan-associated protein